MNEDTRLGEAFWPAQARQGRLRRARNGVYAALDLGTNNCRLLIACPAGDGFRVVDSFSRIIRLGEGISATGSISEAAIDRAIAALEHLPRQDPLPQGAPAAADRDRSLPRRRQCRQFPGQGGQETGIKLEVIDRETEATLAVIGCSPLLDPKGRGAILFDIGGGSTELVRIERDPEQQDAAPRIKAWMSIPLGVVTIAEHFGGRDVTPNPMRGWSRRSRNMSRRSRPSTARICGTCTCSAPPAP